MQQPKDNDVRTNDPESAARREFLKSVRRGAVTATLPQETLTKLTFDEARDDRSHLISLNGDAFLRRLPPVVGTLRPVTVQRPRQVRPSSTTRSKRRSRVCSAGTVRGSLTLKRYLGLLLHDWLGFSAYSRSPGPSCR